MDAGKPGTRQMLLNFSDSKESWEVCNPIANVKKKKKVEGFSCAQKELKYYSHENIVHKVFLKE